MDDDEGPQLLLTETTEVLNEDGHPQHHHKHHHKHHHHNKTPTRENLTLLDGDDTLAQTLPNVDMDDTIDTEAVIPEEEPDRSELSSYAAPLGQFMFCDSLKRFRSAKSRLFRSDEMRLQFYTQNQQPPATNDQAFAQGHMPGSITITSLFHMESNRENKGPEDDGLDDSDLTAADGIVRIRKERTTKKLVVPTDALKITKGDFTFPHRTYKPKCQIAIRGGPNQVPQAVMAERLHRIYKKTDINIVLQTLGIELSDLIPPPNYGENNERFYQEMMFRNRTKINGFDKREVLANGGRLKEYDVGEEVGEPHNMHKPEGDSSLSESDESGSTEGQSSRSTYTDAHEGENEEEKGKSGIHSFILSKPPFNPQFPLSYFDNTEYDIRSGEDWCRLGWDDKEKRYYPLPAKAFLPFPLQADKMAQAKSLSEMTIEEILRKTPRLEKFRAWLLRERFQRQIRLVGLDPSKVTKLSPSELEMAIVARLGSTVQSMASVSDDSLEELHKAAHKFSQQYSRVNELGMSEMANEGSGEKEQEEDGSGSDKEKNQEGSQIVTARDEEQLNIVYKLRQPKRDDDMSDEDEKGLAINDDAKRSVSILSDIFSDLDSLTLLGSDILMPTLQIQGGDVEATDVEEYSEEIEGVEGEGRKFKGHMRPARSYFVGDYGIHIPASPDIDPFEDGFDQYVIDYDKMKKVHIYDWRWADVAVFDYHPSNNKYFVRTISSPVVYAWVSKVHLCFDAEDPNKHGQRIKDAVIRRFEMENWMRYNLYVDCLPMIDFPSLEDGVMKRIINRSITASNLSLTTESLDKVKREINLEYQRTIAEEKFQLLAEKHHKTFFPWVQTPDRSESTIITVIETVSFPAKTQAGDELTPAVQLQNFEFKVKSIQKGTVIFLEEAWKPYKEITNICQDAREKEIILTKLLPMHLDDWEQIQVENIEEIKRYLEEEWYELVVSNLRSNFERTTKSWYNLSETNYDVFIMSKLCNFLQLIKIMMQDTIRSIVKNSCVNLLEQVKSFSRSIHPDSDWSWGEDLITSEYPPPEGLTPIWSLEMYMDPVVGPKYSQPLSSFYRVAYKILNNAVKGCSELPTLLLKVMPQMQFAAMGPLKGIEDNEKEMVDLCQNVVKYTKLILIPLESYINKFTRYRDIWSLDIPSYVKNLEATEPTALDIRKLVDQNRKHIDRLEHEIPSEIKITAFRVIVDHVRDGILKKKKNLIMAILDSYALKLRKIIQKVQKDYHDLEKKLTLRSDDIEEVMELKSYVEIVPSLVARLESITNAAIKDYEVFDYFLYQVSNEDVNAKWGCALNTNRMLRLGREATKWLDDDYDRLLKGQQADLSSLSDQIDSATLTVAGLATYVELEKAKDVCEEIKKIWKTIKDLQEQSVLLNRRQKVFGLPSAQSEALNRLTRDIEPFKNLWFTAADWVTIQETLNTGTMDKIDIEQVNKVISEGGKVMGRCVKYFTGADQLQTIAKSIKRQLEEFKQLVPLVHTLKMPELRQRHWQAISDICGFTIVERVNQNFKKLVDQGIKNFVKEIKEIGELAAKEYEVEHALDKMMKGISTHQITIFNNKEYKMQQLVINPHTLKTMTDYAKVTNILMKNPHKEIFHEKLDPWEKKIHLGKAILELWIQTQDQWLAIQPTFVSPEDTDKIPVIFKLFEKMQRVWRRLIRLAKDAKDILDLLCDEATITALNKFAHQLATIQKSLEDYARQKELEEASRMEEMD